MTFLLDNSPLDAKIVDRYCCSCVGASSLTLGWGGKGGLVALRTGGLVLASLEESMVVLFWCGQSCFLVQHTASLPDMAIWNSIRLCLQPLPLFWMSRSPGGTKKGCWGQTNAFLFYWYLYKMEVYLSIG